MSYPKDYKALKPFFHAHYAPRYLHFDVACEAFKETPFYPFVRPGPDLQDKDCPYCDTSAPIHEEYLGQYVLYCAECETFSTFSSKEIVTSILDVEALLRGIADTLNVECLPKGDYWAFGRQAIGGKSRNLYFAPYASEALVDELLANSSSVLLVFNAETESFNRYTKQLFSMAELQLSPASLDIDWDLLTQTLTDDLDDIAAAPHRGKDTLMNDFIQLLDTEILNYKAYLLRYKTSTDRKKYKIPSIEILAERLGTSKSTLYSRLNTDNYQSKLAHYLKAIFDDPERVITYQGIIKTKGHLI